MSKPFKVKTNRKCDYLVATDTPHGRRCGRPADRKWHKGDDEFFCGTHKDGRPRNNSRKAYKEFWSHS